MHGYAFLCAIYIHMYIVWTWGLKNDKYGAPKADIRKNNIKKTFRLQMGLIVNHQKPGFGSTNDGSIAQRFFANYTFSTSITGINELNSLMQSSMETDCKFAELYPRC